MIATLVFFSFVCFPAAVKGLFTGPGPLDVRIYENLPAGNQYYFGKYVDVDGTYLMVGATTTDDKGHVYIYQEQTPGAYDYLHTETLSAGVSGSRYFGDAISLQDYRMAVGDFVDDFVSIFEATNGEAGMWTLTTTVSPLVPVLTGYGNDVYLEDTLLFIGAAQANNARGAVYVYRETALLANDWIEEHLLTDQIGGCIQGFYGAQVAYDDSTLAVGSLSQGSDPEAACDGGDYEYREGHIYIYHASNFSELVTFIVATGIQKESDRIGEAVDLNNGILAAGGYGAALFGPDSGIVYVFVEINYGQGDFVQVARLFAEDAGPSWQLGISIFVSDEGYVIAGAQNSDTNSAIGSTYIFVEADPRANHSHWIQAAKYYDDGVGTSVYYGCTVWFNDSTLYSGSLGTNEVFIREFTWITECPIGCVHGHCLEAVTGAYCECDLGYEGALCEIDIDECQSNPCENGGSCTDPILGTYNCTCSPGFDGDRCDKDFNECVSSPCINGDCVDQANNYTCECNKGYAGATCNIDVDECSSNPCFHNQTCVDLVNKFTCTCESGYSGTLCEVDLDDCASQPCKRAGVCTDVGADSYVCDCNGTGAIGHDCETDIDECASSPCLNGGLCINTGKKFKFECDCSGTGTSGTVCDIDSDDCLSQPCMSGGTCSDIGIFQYRCDCKSGKTGLHCELDVDDCASNPCHNGGICTDTGRNKFECNCDDVAFSGDLCETQAASGSPCDSFPCQNGGACSGNTSALCECLSSFQGEFCDEFTDDIPTCSRESCAMNLTIFFVDYNFTMLGNITIGELMLMFVHDLPGDDTDIEFVQVTVPTGLYSNQISTTSSGDKVLVLSNGDTVSVMEQENADGVSFVTVYENDYDLSVDVITGIVAASEGADVVDIGEVDVNPAVRIVPAEDEEEPETDPDNNDSATLLVIVAVLAGMIVVLAVLYFARSTLAKEKKILQTYELPK